MSKETIYLCGSIGRDDRTYLWRESFVDFMKYDDVEILNPCDNTYNILLRDMYREQREYEHRYGKASESLERRIETLRGRCQRVLKAKDYVLVGNSTLLVWNTNYNCSVRPSQASLIEFTWATDIFHIPTILIAAGSNPWVDHGWIGDHASAIVRGVKDSVEYIRTFFL